jgi:hypothetical protein
VRLELGVLALLVHQNEAYLLRQSGRSNSIGRHFHRPERVKGMVQKAGFLMTHGAFRVTVKGRLGRLVKHGEGSRGLPRY